MLVKNLTDKRLNELMRLNQQTRATANVLKIYLEMVESGEFDEHIDDLLKQIEDLEKREEEDLNEYLTKRENLNSAKKLNKCRITLSKGKAPLRAVESKRKNSPNSDLCEDASSQHPAPDIVIKTEIDTDEEYGTPSRTAHIRAEVDNSPSVNMLLDSTKGTNVTSLSNPSTPTSPLLTSLLRNVSSANPCNQTTFSVGSSPLKEVKVESSSHPPMLHVDTSSANSRKNDVFLSPPKIPSAGISPLLTSLLKTPTTAVTLAPASTSTASLHKECDFADTSDNAKSGLLSEIEVGGLTKSRETSPRSTVPQSPRPAPASSPLLNSLLKNSPSNAPTFSPLQIQQPKEATTPKAVSSPQPFFNPTSALATAAAQQLAVATATLPQTHQFFLNDSPENRKHSIQNSPATSACLSAPTLSKLLEMPPSTPGRLPPLPVVEAPVTSVSSISTSPSDNVSSESMSKSSTIQVPDAEPSVRQSPDKKLSDKTSYDKITVSESPKTSKDSELQEEEKNIPASKSNEKNKFSNQKSPQTDTSLDIENTSQENLLDILEEASESINEFLAKEEIKTEPMDIEDYQCSVDVTQEAQQLTSPDVKSIPIKIEDFFPEDVSNISSQAEKKLPNFENKIEEKVVSSPNIIECVDSLTSEGEQVKKDVDIVNTSSEPSGVPETVSSDKADVTPEEDRGINSRKFYKSRMTSKKRSSTEEESSEKSHDGTPLKPPAKKIRTKLDFDASPQHFISDSAADVPVKQSDDLSGPKDQETKSPTKGAETKSPASKKPRIFEKAASKESKEHSEDEVPLAKRAGRREYFAARKGRGKVPKTTPTKTEEPKDQYEFSESTEENSVGYQTTNTLCYMPRVKDESRFEESKAKAGAIQDSEERKSSNMGSPVVEKKYLHSPLRSKQARTSLGSTPSRKNLFASDEERMSDSLTSDETSNSVFGDDKLKKWKDSTEKEGDDTKDLSESKTASRPPKSNDSPKKKSQPAKKNTIKSETPVKKEKKLTSSDLEELSRDSEDVSTLSTWQRKEGDSKEKNPSTSGDIDIETTDSHLSSSVAAESDKQMDDIEGFESLQGSVTTEFSPLPPSEMKEEKDISQFGKQDWFHGSSPKSSEAVSQSSEESEEYESDNWDNQSVSTNKSTSHSASQQPRLKRKERESPQYKAWKKAISIVLREASCHKYANVFLQKVTNDVAPGYLSIVYRPMDLSLIKKNIDNGIVKTTDEFHRDMMLMFQNAIMYNSSDHDVHHMAIEMQRDVIQQIQAFLTTQSNDKDENGEPASSLRGGRTIKSQKTYGSSITKSRDEADRNE
ncbi:bromodomain-containing protein 8-like isoform X1 [Stegodyphus dumicola]|uniref:bromodomain-containing protein 8-like isoform X1 n=1 Tax=Stegodyphus dumicola TaxID=202533 RepID=UPI0015A9CB2F|nr:bromodomain-containing protein 8-like isoform X1 [Stegodyphus dumicola]